MAEVKRFMAPGPWITRDLKPCVLAEDYDRLLDIMRDQLELAVQFLRDRSDDGVMDEDDEALLRQCETTLEWATTQHSQTSRGTG